MGKNYRNRSKTSKTPRRPFEKERLDRELKLVGVFGRKLFTKIQSEHVPAEKKDILIFICL